MAEACRLVAAASCPRGDSVYGYTNSLQHTVVTAQFFTSSAFLGCDIAVHYPDKMGEMGPTFNLIITDDSAAFNPQGMKTELTSLRLATVYYEIEKIVDYSDSSA